MKGNKISHKILKLLSDHISKFSKLQKRGTHMGTQRDRERQRERDTYRDRVGQTHIHRDGHRWTHTHIHTQSKLGRERETYQQFGKAG